MSLDWRERLTELLIKGGTNGVKQRDLTYELEQFVTASEIVEHLEGLLAADKVQRFRVPTRGRPALIWRATTKILEDMALPKEKPNAKAKRTEAD